MRKDECREFITGPKASEYLETSQSNRPVQQWKIDSFMKDMSEGKWKYTGESIIFDEKGRLRDGHARLTSLVKASELKPGLNIEMLVIRGVPEDAVAHIDTGTSRSGATTLGNYYEVKNATQMSTALKLLDNYENKRLLKTPVTAGHQKDLLDKNQGLLDSVSKMCGMRNNGNNKGISVGWLGTCHYLCSKKSRHDADIFFEKLMKQEGFSDDDPIRRLYKKLTSRVVTNDLSRTNWEVKTICLFKAWNFFRTGKSCGKLTAYEGEVLPSLK